VILVDTSIWINHLSRGEPALVKLLSDAEVLLHPFVIGELACGNLRRRAETIGLLSTLPQVSVSEHEEVLGFVETHRLAGRGIGWVDAHLLAAASLTGVPVWSADRVLVEAARSLRIHWAP